MKKELTAIFQDNELTSSRQEFSALEKNILFMLMAQLKKDDNANKAYYISVNELHSKTGVKNQYVNYKEATKCLVTKYVEIKKPNGNLLQTTFLSHAEYIKGTGIIEIGISPKIRPYLFELKSNFTVLQLELALTLKSKYSKRIYEMLSQYKDTGFFSISIHDLKNRLGLIDTKTGVEQYTKWSMFESRVLKIAEKEINTYTDIKMMYEPKKTGRSYHRVEFSFTHQPYQTNFDFKDESTAIFGRLINDLKLRKDQAYKLTQLHTEKELHKMIFEAKQAIRDRANGSQSIKDIGAWCAKRFNV